MIGRGGIVEELWNGVVFVGSCLVDFLSDIIIGIIWFSYFSFRLYSRELIMCVSWKFICNVYVSYLWIVKEIRLLIDELRKFDRVV